MALRSTETSATEQYDYTTRRLADWNSYVSESPDALRRRADLLLDEMMLGAVDVAASESAFDAHDLSGAAEQLPSDNGHSGWRTEPAYDSGNGQPWRTPSPERGALSTAPGYGDSVSDSPAAPQDEALSHRAGEATRRLPGESLWERTEPTSVSSRPVDRQAAPARGHVEPRLIPAEARYAQYTSPRPDVVTGAHGETAREQPQGAVAPLANGRSQSAVRRQAPSAASTMSIGSQGKLRTTLLPRSSELDAERVQQEIDALLGEIQATLPVGHEAAERGRHLLGKAESILQTDPSRTAEVEYYLQQVHRIVERTRQTHAWSALYRRRLTVYLMGWLALSAVVLAAQYLFPAELTQLIEDLFWIDPTARWMQYSSVVAGAAVAGSFGAALVVLVNIQRHARREYGYFDRKYGLRGLLLPLLGFGFGLLLALAWSTFCFFVELPGTALWVGLVPALFAFVLGSGQEWLYGAR
ncbi:MAG: hypothetical protein H3C34_06905 [Caldilineaceae bacterium]|nr:hypothetical protein [Caldilineaceae bacterium]